MDDLLPLVGAIHLCRLIQLLINSGQGGQVDDGVPADVRPDIRYDINGNEIIGLVQHIRDRHAE